MSARRPRTVRQICDPIARTSVAEAMRRTLSRRSYRPVEPREVMQAGINLAADQCARMLAASDLGLAHAFARVHAELLASQRRMFARWEARDAAEAVSA